MWNYVSLWLDARGSRQPWPPIDLSCPPQSPRVAPPLRCSFLISSSSPRRFASARSSSSRQHTAQVPQLPTDSFISRVRTPANDRQPLLPLLHSRWFIAPCAMSTPWTKPVPTLLAFASSAVPHSPPSTPVLRTFAVWATQLQQRAFSQVWCMPSSQTLPMVERER